jgi:deoxyhypusine monooxygenase
LGAIGHDDALDTLRRLSSHPAPEISETCQIAVDLILWRKGAASSGDVVEAGLYRSVDPAPPHAKGSRSVEELTSLLTSTDTSLFQRYRAMFSLRDMNSDEAVLALVQGFQDNSALFRHEIAYVLGQMQRPSAIPGLEAVLQKESEHRMVRHEAAESIGAIGGEDAESILKKYLADEEYVVQQSCEVALDTMDYWSGQTGVESNNQTDTSDDKQAPIKYL